MLESLHFSYDGISSHDKGVMMVKTSGGLYDENFLPNRSIVEQSVPGRNAPYFVRVDNEPLSFSISIALIDREFRNQIRDVARWLFTDEYKPLYFESNPNRVFYAIFEGNSSFIHNGLKQGYVTLNVRTNSPFGFSPPKKDVFNVNGAVTKEYFNEGDLKIRPNLVITKRGAGNVSIKNNTTNQELIIRDMLDGEVATLDCANEQIYSSYENVIPRRYLFDKHNDVWLDWDKYENNQFTFTGNFTVEFQYEYVYLQEYDLLDPLEEVYQCR